jgi:hypothetical protein
VLSIRLNSSARNATAALTAFAFNSPKVATVAATLVTTSRLFIIFTPLPNAL